MDLTLYNNKKFDFDKEKIKEIKKFTLLGNVWAYCNKVIDGDSIQVCFYIHNEIFRFSVRLDGIDTPELRSKNIKEKKFAKEIKKYLKSMIENDFVNLELLKFDKYGRILANVYYNNESINKLLVDRGYAKIYSGGTKEKWFE